MKPEWNQPELALESVADDGDAPTHYPINEIFGPTIQGEGPMIGRRTFFVRFAGCDYDCLWCDTKYAVNPKYPGWAVKRLTASEIIYSLRNYGCRHGDVVTLSGGNPALFVEDELCSLLGSQGYSLAIETQGSKVLPTGLLNRLDVVVVSPKPPSSGMADRTNYEVLADLLRRHFMDTSVDNVLAIKIVVFTDEDFDWAVAFRQRMVDLLGNDLTNFYSWYMSVGTLNSTDLEETLATHRNEICDRMAWLMEKVLSSPDYGVWRVLPQLHSLAWGNKRGV